MVEVAQRSSLIVGLVRSDQRPGAYTLVVKASYDLNSRPQGVLHREQAPLREAVRDGGGRLFYPNDFVATRDACDVSLVGEVLAAEGPVIARVGSLQLRAHRAAELGPVDESESGREGSYARAAARMPFPSLPLTVEVQGSGWFASVIIPAPRPFAGLVVRGDWASVSPLALQIDGVAIDPFRSRVELVMRTYFQHPGDVDRDVVALIDGGDELFRSKPEDRATWPRAPAADRNVVRAPLLDIPETIDSEDTQDLPGSVGPGETVQLPVSPAAHLRKPEIDAPRVLPPLERHDTVTVIVLPQSDESTADVPPPIARAPMETLPQIDDQPSIALPFLSEATPILEDPETPPPPSPQTSVLPLPTPAPVAPSTSPPPPPVRETAPPPAALAVETAPPFAPATRETLPPLSEPPTADARETLPPTSDPPVTGRETLPPASEPPVSDLRQTAAPPPLAAPRTQPPPPLDADEEEQPSAVRALPFARKRARTITDKPPPTPAPALPFRITPLAAPRIIPPAPPSGGGLPFAPTPQVMADSTRAARPLGLDEVKHVFRLEGMTVEEYAAIRAALWVEGAPRKKTLKDHGLTELRWRVVERKWERHFDEVGPEALAPLVDLLAAASARAASPENRAKLGGPTG